MLAAVGELHEHRFQFVILAPKDGPLLEAAAVLNIPAEEFRSRDPDGTRLSPQILADHLNREALRLSLDLIHANSLTMGRHLGAAAAMVSIPTTSHVRDIMSLSKATIRDLNQHRRLIAVSDATRDFHIEQGIDPKKIQRVYNGVDCKKFQPRKSSGELKRQLQLSTDATLIATIGQICLRKSQTDLAEAAVLLKKKHPDTNYLIVGERHSTKRESIEFDAQISDVFNAAGISSRLHRLGYVETMPDLLNQVEILVHPARQEPLGRVLLEAAASGVAMVATSVGGTAEILEDQKSALLVEPKSPAALANAMSQLLMSRELRFELGIAAREAVVQKFALADRAEELADAWKQTLSGE